MRDGWGTRAFWPDWRRDGKDKGRSKGKMRGFFAMPRMTNKKEGNDNSCDVGSETVYSSPITKCAMDGAPGRFGLIGGETARTKAGAKAKCGGSSLCPE